MTPTNPAVSHAVRAARCWHIWGRYAASRFCQKHGVPPGLITLARQLAAAERAGI